MCVVFDPIVCIFTLSPMSCGGSVSGLAKICIDSYPYYFFFIEIFECRFRNSLSHFLKLWLLCTVVFRSKKVLDFDKWQFLTNVWVTFVESTISKWQHNRAK